MNAKQVAGSAANAASQAAGFVAFNEWSITLYRLGVGVLCYYLATNYQEWKAAIEEIPAIATQVQDLKTNSSARPDPFTGEDGEQLRDDLLRIIKSYHDKETSE